jgi:glutamine synthetase
MHSTLTNGKPITKRDVLRIAKERDVRFVRLSFVDILGINKSVSVPVGELERAIEGRVTFDGGSIDGFVRGEEADMRLLPDLSTFAVYPWTSGGHYEARMICNIATPDGEPFEGCPRTTLMRAIDDASDVASGLQERPRSRVLSLRRGPTACRRPIRTTSARTSTSTRAIAANSRARRS